ncbi:RNA polymerase III transcription factor IIIC subunit-domain-containing protein [Phlyctochytrium arcticum]|nr:RNA polymerase III transcription factor IIIC subunit-domain-containing protein [Phlyctochytrium arcticum]
MSSSSQRRSVSLPPDEAAPSEPLPEDSFHVVEYPGYIKNVDKAMKNLGGMGGVEKAFAGELSVLELRYRPDDPFSHPISGEIINTANVLLKVTRKKDRKITQRSTKTEVMGLVTKTGRFRALADYQWVPDRNDPMVKLRYDMHTMNVEGVENYRWGDDSASPVSGDLRQMPPPSFSRLEWPLNYGYRQNPSVTRQTEIRLVNRYQKTKANVAVFDESMGSVPTEPPPGVTAKDLPPDALTATAELFARRPIWNRVAFKNNLPPAHRARVKRLLPLYAYVISKGPWRDLWVRYGYDPRSDIEARLLQIMDVRFVKAPKSFARAKRLIGVTGAAQLLGKPGGEQELAPAPDPEEDKTHIFDGQVYRNLLAVYQLCDVTDPDLVKMINTTRYLRKTCHERDGWYVHSHYEAMREVMKRKMALLQGKEVADTDFSWEEGVPTAEELQAAEDEANSLEKGKQRAEMEERVKSKVDELMKNLQGQGADGKTGYVSPAHGV